MLEQVSRRGFLRYAAGSALALGAAACVGNEAPGSSRGVWFAQFDIVLEVSPDRV